jgi:uncharacterized protein
MIVKLGGTNRMTVIKKVDFGMYLDGGEEGEILLPMRYVPEDLKIGDEIDVFIYLDNEERLIATTEIPYAKVGDFAWLEVAWVNEFGAFLDWGLMKDLFVPFREQKMKMEIGNKYIVHVHIDEESYRIVASAKIEHFFPEEEPPYEHNDRVNILVWQKTELGFKVIVDNKYPGLVYEDEVFRHLQTGDRLEAYIDQVRPDGKIDLRLQITGRKHTEEFSEILKNYLKENNGECDLGDKSAADDIYARFQVSKKTFKKAIGDLYRQRLIIMTDKGFRLI